MPIEENPYEWKSVETVCKFCKRPMTVRYPSSVLDMFHRNNITVPAAHADCQEKADRERDAEQAITATYEEEDRRLYELAENAGVKPKYNLASPPVRYVATWLWKNQYANILLSGETGSGKSTSIGTVTRNLLKAGKTVKVMYFSGLLDEWRDARMDDNPSAVHNFMDALERPDYLILDELADKTVNTESTRECMFRLLEDVANGACHARVWLLGNFYCGSVADIFGDEAPAVRRIKENFTCARIDCGRIVPIFQSETPELNLI